MKFTELNLSPEVIKGVDKAGFVDCTMVQEKVLPTSLTGKDVMVQSKTGSGKTAVFLLTIFQRHLASGRKSRALVVSPTRELAVQIEEDAKLLSSGIDGYRVGCFYGGVGYEAQNNEIKEGLDLYVGTPGRLLDYAKSRKIDFRQFDTVVLDEADRMFDMGFYPDIRNMFGMMRDKSGRQTMLFSATLSTKVRNLAWNYMNDPKEIEVQPEEITVKNITQELYHVTRSEKFSMLLSILKKIDPQSCLIFTNTKDMAVEVSRRLNMNGYKTEYLMGDMAQSKRLETLDRMKEGKIHFLVATDVAARGLQIDDLELVVNYDIPEDFENYVHRIGRTARAGKSGIAVTLACETYIYGLEAIENYIQMKIPVHWADEDGLESVEDKSEGYHYSSSRRKISPKAQRKSDGGRRDLRTKKQSFRDKTEMEKRDDTLDYKSSTDFNKIRSMSLEERMSYYKSAYGDKTAPKGNGSSKSASGKKKSSQGGRKRDGESASRAPRPQGGAENRAKAKDARKPQEERRKEFKKSVVETPQPKVEVKETPASPQKKGFFSRIKEMIFGKQK